MLHFGSIYVSMYSYVSLKVPGKKVFFKATDSLFSRNLSQSYLWHLWRLTTNVDFLPFFAHFATQF